MLIIYDDLTKHAGAYRELSLLLRRPPGRGKTYPGDIFYLLMVAADEPQEAQRGIGPGSLTALPIAETQQTTCICSANLISITDGQDHSRHRSQYGRQAGCGCGSVGLAWEVRLERRRCGVRLQPASWSWPNMTKCVGLPASEPMSMSRHANRSNGVNAGRTY